MSETTLANITVLTEGVEELVIGIVQALSSTGGVADVTDPQSLPQQIGQRKKVKLKESEDGKHVLKLSDAIGCVEELLNGPVIGPLLIAWLTSSLRGNSRIDDVFIGMGKAAVVCMRKKVLSQLNPRHSATGPHQTRKK